MRQCDEDQKWPDNAVLVEKISLLMVVEVVLDCQRKDEATRPKFY